EPAHPALHGGRDLKQRRIGLFWSLPAFHRRRGLLKRLVLHCQVSGRETLPTNPRQHNSVLEFEVLPRLHRAATPKHSRPRITLNELRRWGRLGECYDRTYS